MLFPRSTSVPYPTYPHEMMFPFLRLMVQVKRIYKKSFPGEGLRGKSPLCLKLVTSTTCACPNFPVSSEIGECCCG